MSWDYVCKICGRDFFTAHPDPTSICWSCWSTKFTEAERQQMLPGATPLEDKPLSLKERLLSALRESSTSRGGA